MSDTERYPLDYDTVQQGDVISIARLVEIIGCASDTAKFHALRNDMCQEIEKCLWDRGNKWTVCIVKGEIRVLTDPEASRYNSHGFRKHQRGLVDSHRHMLAVNVGCLSIDDQRTHDRTAKMQGVTLAAMAAASRYVVPMTPPREPPQLQAGG